MNNNLHIIMSHLYLDQHMTSTSQDVTIFVTSCDANYLMMSSDANYLMTSCDVNNLMISQHQMMSSPKYDV